MIKCPLLRVKYITLAIFISLLALSACDTSVKSDKALVGEAIKAKNQISPSETFIIDTTKSQITWIGAKITGRHNGYFKIKTGKLHMDNDMLASGSIVIDMTSLRSDDKSIDQASNEKLTKHLKSADFFDVEEYSTANFELTGIAPYDSTKITPAQPRKPTDNALRVKKPTHLITGNLTIKGETKSITFPAKVTLEDKQLKAKANFNIDRTKWGLIYRSDKSMGNQTIHPEVNLGFDIIANPQVN
jgi:polyisoprenoid-binding protein YceI